ncbi:hypothetical protein Poli38472_003550 [Pythium oligandrum]|uniref:RING-type domain-containing protein n=1 Tax=Pythium oligandrum TaxID=41045 RepID=A0A8K1C712_PYTOL|nr:hypothetical protein Poli38472_003550 [Pythium oligandrum]|eukprot:TMW57625.1 hypothetical protein Poli38472_003550 [Pythium oligandrum]
MEITVRVEVQYNAPEQAIVRDMLRMFRTPVWVRFMVRYISPHLKNCAPANKEIMEQLAKWRVSHTPDQHTQCVICMNDASEVIELPCGHQFHQDCIESWLKMRSTCPTCRHQLPKAFSGCYAVRTLNSALLLKEDHRDMPKEEILNSRVGKEPVCAVVNVTLGRVGEESKEHQFPCVLNALLLHSNGDVFSESDSTEKLASPTSTSSATPTTERRRYQELPGPHHEVSHSRSKRVRVN